MARQAERERQDRENAAQTPKRRMVPWPPMPVQRAQAAILEVLNVSDRHERAGLIRESILDHDESYVEAFEDAMIDAGVGVHGELSPAAQRRVAVSQQPGEKPEKSTGEQVWHGWSLNSDEPKL